MPPSKKAAKKAAAVGGGGGGSEPPSRTATPASSSGGGGGGGGASAVVSDLLVTFGTNEKKIHDNSRDVFVEGLSVQFHGTELLKDATLALAYGQRYALVGLNGSGKTSILRMVAARMIPIPKGLDVYSVEHPIDPTDLSALEAVLEVDQERRELEEEVERLGDAMAEDGVTDAEQAELSDRLNEVYERLDAMDAATATGRASGILRGLGFTKEMQEKKTKDFSGGWRMRIALARALFVDPSILVLDGPTAHLDLEAVVWFEEYLKKFKKILLLVSHSQDFMDGVATQVILLRNKTLTYFGGDYTTYRRTRAELETNQQKQYEWERDQIQHMKDYIARFGHGSAKLAKQAQSKEKTLAKMERGGLTEAVTFDKPISIKFANVGKIPPPVIQLQDVSFKYPNGKEIYRNLDFGADLDSRICLVGKNGGGKSTILKLISGDLVPTEGMVRRHTSLRLAVMNQHSADQLNMDETPLQYIMREFPKDQEGKPQSIESARSIIGRVGVTGEAQTKKIGQLSDGQKARVVFAWLIERRPHFILFDEPTNPLDSDTTQSLAEAINSWDGGCIIVSHDLALVQSVCKELWVCENGLTRFPGTVLDYKKKLRKEMGL